MTWKTICIHSITALLLTLFLISGSVILVLAFRPLYYLDIRALNISEESGLSEEEIRENYNALIDYNLSFGNEELVFPTLAMSEAGRIHFQEVKAIFRAFQYMAVAAALSGGTMLVILTKRREYLFLKLTAILSVALPVVLGILVAINWDRVFVAFHELVFDNDYWLFDPATDPVITILPDAFFMHCALMILGCVVLGSTVCALIWRRKRTA